MKSTFRNQSNFTLGEFQGDMEVNNEDSLTVPNLGLDLEKFIKMGLRGVDLANYVRSGQYDNEPEFDGEPGYITGDTDLTDIDEIKSRIENERGKAVKVPKAENGSSAVDDSVKADDTVKPK